MFKVYKKISAGEMCYPWRDLIPAMRPRSFSCPISTARRSSWRILAGQAADLLLSQGRHPGVHPAGVQHPGHPGGVAGPGPGGGGPQPRSAGAAAEVRRQIRPGLSPPGGPGPPGGGGLRRLGRKDALRQEIPGHHPLVILDRCGRERSWRPGTGSNRKTRSPRPKRPWATTEV